MDAPTLFHPAIGPAETQYKTFMHQQYIHQPRVLPFSGMTGQQHQLDHLIPEQLSTSVVRISVILEQQVTATTEKNLLKTPSWDRISS
jgi:hypothetical protein